MGRGGLTHWGSKKNGQKEKKKIWENRMLGGSRSKMGVLKTLGRKPGRTRKHPRGYEKKGWWGYTGGEINQGSFPPKRINWVGVAQIPPAGEASLKRSRQMSEPRRGGKFSKEKMTSWCEPRLFGGSGQKHTKAVPCPHKKQKNHRCLGINEPNKRSE